MDNEEIKQLVKERVAVIDMKRAYDFALQNPGISEMKKQQEIQKTNALLDGLEEMTSHLEELIQSLHYRLVSITEQTSTSAVYLLLGKAYSSLESTILLCRSGKSFEAIEISRSGNESLDLVYLFLEEENNLHLQKWFEGKVVDNKVSRDFQHNHLNRELSENFPDQELPVSLFKAGIYKVLSRYTHSTYAGILDCVDVYTHQYDFQRRAGYHYAIENFHVVEDLARSLVQMLRLTFIKFQDQESLLKTNALYELFDNEFSEEEYMKAIDKYSKKD